MLNQLQTKITAHTMIMDKGVGVNNLKDTLAYAGQYLSSLKYGFGTSCLYDRTQLINKNDLLTTNGIITYPGGTTFEIAYSKNLVNVFFDDLQKYNFTGVEISHGTVDVPDSDRYKYIKHAKKLNLMVFSEIGKKNKTGFDNLLDAVNRDIDAGSDFVILEGRESGTSGLYGSDGNVSDDILNIFDNDEQLLNKIIWEAPTKEQQIVLLKKFGANVNLGNIAYNDILSLAALRRGLRNDTFFHL